MSDQELMKRLDKAIEELPLEDATLFKSACGDLANLLLNYPELRIAYHAILISRIFNASK